MATSQMHLCHGAIQAMQPRVATNGVMLMQSSAASAVAVCTAALACCPALHPCLQCQLHRPRQFPRQAAPAPRLLLGVKHSVDSSMISAVAMAMQGRLVAYQDSNASWLARGTTAASLMIPQVMSAHSWTNNAVDRATLGRTAVHQALFAINRAFGTTSARSLLSWQRYQAMRMQQLPKPTLSQKKGGCLRSWLWCSSQLRLTRWQKAGRWTNHAAPQESCNIQRLLVRQCG